MSEELAPETPDKPTVPELLPFLTLSDAVVFPSMVIPLIVQGEREVKAIENAALGQKVVGLFWRRRPGEGFDPQDIGQTGTAAHIVRLMRLANGSIQLLLQGLARIQIQQLVHTDPYPLARALSLPDPSERSTALEGQARGALSLFQEVVNLAPYLPPELASTAASLPEPGILADFIAAHLNLRLEERQAILDTLDVSERLRQVTELLQREKEILEIGRKAQQEMSKAQREYVLRQQMEAIRRELGDTDERLAEVNALRERLEQAQLPEEARKEAERELERLAHMPPGAAEYVVARTYLDWILDLPWKVSTEDNLDLRHAQQVLDEDHYDLERVKERIIEYLAVRALRPQAKGPLLCFVGPPGVGKTSLGQSIARALGRKFVRLSLGGVRDEAEIRGHRRTYIGALPGRIIQGLRRAGARNPVFMLDEDVHIHVPAGAIPKDGSSAGITIATALISALTQRPVNKHVAMTGEITLSGRVLPIGGVKEKVLAAQRVGVHTVILPRENQIDLRDVPASAREQLRFVFAEHMDEVLPVALHPVSQSGREPAAVPG